MSSEWRCYRRSGSGRDRGKATWDWLPGIVSFPFIGGLLAGPLSCAAPAGNRTGSSPTNEVTHRILGSIQVLLVYELLEYSVPSDEYLAESQK